MISKCLDIQQKLYIQQPMKKVFFYFSIHACNCYIIILIKTSQVYITNLLAMCILSNCLILINYIIILQHQLQIMTIMPSTLKKKRYFYFGQILDKASLGTRNIAK